LQKTKDPGLKTSLNRQITKVKDLMAEHRKNKYNNLLGSLNEGSNAWTRFYRLNRALIRKPQHSRPLKNALDNTIFDPKSKADLLADSLEDQFRSPPGNVIIDFLVHDKLIHQRTIPSTSTSFFSPAEVWNVIKSLPSRRTPGPDGISNCVHKNCGRKTITYLCRIFNWCKRLKYIGVHVDKKLNFSKHVTTAVNKAKSVKYLVKHSLYPLIFSPSLNINTK